VSVSRRKFLEMGSLLAATGVAMPLEAATKHLNADFGMSDQSQVVALNYFTVDSLQQYVGTNFTVQDTAKTSVTFSLAAVKTLSQRSMGPAIDGFTMQFRNKSTRFLPQGTYTFVHHNLGTFKLFIVPAGKSKSSAYFAVINHLAAA
jgi:uncharacterized protein DUF6916